MRKLKYLFFLLLFLSQQVRAEGYQKTDLGVIATTQSVRLEIQFFSPEIVRVLKTPEGASVENKSLSVVKNAAKQDLKISNDGDNVTIESSALRVILNLTTGKIAYQTVNGEILLTEKDYGVQFTPVKDVNKACPTGFYVRKRRSYIRFGTATKW